MQRSNPFLLFLIFILFPGLCWGELSLNPEDLRMEQRLDSGYHLFIRQKEGMGSVLITESTKDPEGKAANYALRNPEYHPVNGDEKRMLDGKFLDTSAGLYSLIDSTPEEHPELGPAFHVFIPYVAVYGYPWSRSGEIQILDGTYLNVRVFEKPYGDYRGGFKDNPFILRVVQIPLPGPPEQNYREDTVKSFKEIAKEAGGEAELSVGEETLVGTLERIVTSAKGKSLDLVLALDTTQSMEDDLLYLAEELVPMLQETTTGFDRFRLGMVLYKDYYEEYLTKVIPFQDNLEPVTRILYSINAMGGRDIPEAVFEALYVALNSFVWEADSRLIILVGDAPPHPKPRGKVTAEMVFNDAKAYSVEIHTIILPQ